MKKSLLTLMVLFSAKAAFASPITVVDCTSADGKISVKIDRDVVHMGHPSAKLVDTLVVSGQDLRLPNEVTSFSASSMVEETYTSKSASLELSNPGPASMDDSDPTLMITVTPYTGQLTSRASGQVLVSNLSCTEYDVD